MSIKKYDIAKDFKRGIISRIECRSCNWDKESLAFNEGWSWANDNLSNLIHEGLNKYLKSIGEETMAIIKLQHHKD